jgi:hypothetical protein
MDKINYEEGDWFAVPLGEDYWVAGIAARASRDGSVFGFFFGPKTKGIPSLPGLVGLRPADAVFEAMFGYLGLVTGSWVVIGAQPNFKREDWPMPVFVHHDDLRDLYSHRWYEEDRLDMIREEYSPRGVVLEGPTDGLFGHGAVEIRLRQLLREVPGEAVSAGLDGAGDRGMEGLLDGFAGEKGAENRRTPRGNSPEERRRLSSGDHLDDMVLGLIDARGGLGEPRRVIHFLYAADERAARSLALVVAEAGWRVVRVEESAVGGSWLVEVDRESVVIVGDEVEESREFFEAAATQVGGAVYDGWEVVM